MLALFACISFGFLCGQVSGYSSSDYTLLFQNQGTKCYANIWGMRSLSQFTICFWMKSAGKGKGTPFSYAVPGEDNEILIFDYNNFELYIDGEKRTTSMSATDGEWHHICVAWRNTDGKYIIYKDGVVGKSGTNFKKDYEIKADGSLVLGQEQDALGGKFVSSQSFIGSLTNVNVWSVYLKEDTIKKLSECCKAGQGDVYSWSDFVHGIKGNTRVVIPSSCSKP